jgi:hypothetical protein
VPKIKYQSSESNTEVRSTVVSRYDQAFTGTSPQLRRNISALSDEPFHERVKLGELLFATGYRSPCIHGFWRLYPIEQLSLLSQRKKDGGVVVTGCRPMEKFGSEAQTLRLEVHRQSPIRSGPKGSRKSASLIQFTVEAQVIGTHKLSDIDNLPVVHSEVFHHLVNRF